MRLGLAELMKPISVLAQSYASRRQELATSQKSAGQFVSEADEAIESAIRDALSERYGNVPMIGEEQGGALDTAASCWAIDPIDGTSNFLRGLPMWGVSIGLLERGDFVAGVIALPELNLILSNEPGQALHLNDRSFVRPKNPLGGKLIALGENDFETGDQTDNRAASLRAEGYTVVRYRSAVFSLASAALGRLDGYVEHGCCLWDVAAAASICRAVGLAVSAESLGGERFSIDARAIS